MPTPESPAISLEDRRLLSPVVAPTVFALGAVATLALWLIVGSAEKRVLATRFQAAASERLTGIEHELNETLNALEELESLYAIAPELSATGFARFARPYLERHPWLVALGWNLHLSHAEREEHEATRRLQATPQYEVRERGPDGRLVRAGERPEYVPVCFIEPLEDNLPALGFDVGSEPVRRAALSRARDTGKRAVSARIQLVQDGSEALYSVLVFEPVYRGGSKPEKLAQRRESIMGYFVGVIRIADLIAGALERFDEAPFEARVVDEQAAPGQALLLGTDAPAARGSLRHVASLRCADRNWQVELVTQPPSLIAAGRWLPLLVLLGGFALSGLSFAYLNMFRTRALKIAALAGERERAQRALRESEARLRLILDSITEGGWDLDLERDTVDLSSRWLSSLGHEHVASQRELFRGAVHPDDVARNDAALEAHLSGELPLYECELRLRCADGSWRWTSRRGRVVEQTPDGRPRRLVGVDTDATRKRRLEEQHGKLQETLRHTQHLESLGVLAGGIAHDFNNLLMGILGNTELALKYHQSGQAEQLVAALGEVELAGRHASELVNQMLAYAGKSHASVTAVDVRALLGEMSGLIETTTSAGAIVRYELEPELPLVNADVQQLRQALLSLLTNAADALEERDGVVQVRAQQVEVDREQLDGMQFGPELEPGSYVSIEIEDTGVGMDSHTQAHMFEPFFSTKFQGRGLGLAATLGILRSHGGAIAVDSELGRGTRVRLLLPPSEAPRPEIPDKLELPAQAFGHGQEVLLVDDEDAVLRVTRQLLQLMGFTVATAHDGIEALKLLREQDFDLVLLDFVMPKMGGAETLRQLRQLRPELPVLIMSGFDEDATLASVAGASGFLQKPFAAKQLLSCIQAATRAR